MAATANRRRFKQLTLTRVRATLPRSLPGTMPHSFRLLTVAAAALCVSAACSSGRGRDGGDARRPGGGRACSAGRSRTSRSHRSPSRSRRPARREGTRGADARASGWRQDQLQPRAGDPAGVAAGRSRRPPHPRPLRAAGRPHRRPGAERPGHGRRLHRADRRTGLDRRAAHPRFESRPPPPRPGTWRPTFSRPSTTFRSRSTSGC